MCANAGAIANDEATRVAAAEAVRCLLNLERAARGLRDLRASGLLQSAAEGHSRDMVSAKFVGHRSLNGANVRQRVKRTGYIRRSKVTLVGEVLSWGSGTFASPSQLVAALMESPQHKRTVLDRRFRDVGVGMALGAPMAGMGSSRSATVTVDFGRR